MKKDIIQPEVKDVYIAIVGRKNEFDETEWVSYLINNRMKN